MTYELKFIEPSDQMKAKHGNFTCSWCRDEGVKSLGKVCTYKNSISWRKDTCSCDKHRDDAIRIINRQRDRENEDLTEADYQTWMRL
jgi:hypothetical protein